jgi:hypothetical protein
MYCIAEWLTLPDAAAAAISLPTAAMLAVEAARTTHDTETPGETDLAVDLIGH